MHSGLAPVLPLADSKPLSSIPGGEQQRQAAGAVMAYEDLQNDPTQAFHRNGVDDDGRSW